MKKAKKLPEAELKIMMAVWENRPPVSRTVLSQQLAENGWTDPTILTMLGRLVKKGFLACEKQGNKNMYTPLISKEEYMVTESISFTQKLQDISLTGLMAALVDSRGITQDEITRLEEMLQRYKDSDR